MLQLRRKRSGQLFQLFNSSAFGPAITISSLRETIMAIDTRQVIEELLETFQVF